MRFNKELKDLIARLSSEKGVKPARKALSQKIVKDSEPYVPVETEGSWNPTRHPGKLRKSVRINQSGTRISYNTSYARYMWYGHVMYPWFYSEKLKEKYAGRKGGDRTPIQGFWSPKGESKHPDPSHYIDFHYPKATMKWTMMAAEDHMREWEQTVAEELFKQ